MKKAKLILLIVVCFSNQIYSQSGWIQQLSGTTHNLTEVEFLNSNTGWIVGRLGTILTTTNGGTNWIQQTNGTNNEIYKVNFTDSLNGWTVCHDSLRNTIDGGVNWNARAFTYVPAYDIHFANLSTGWTVGAYGVITKTTNRGVNWTVYKYTSGSNFISMYFINSNTGWAVGSSGLIRKTTNGTDWTLQTGPSAGYHYYSVYFPDADNGWIVGSAGHIIKTTNGGTTWTTQTTQAFENLLSVYFINSVTGWTTGGNGKILKTTNGGGNWQQQTAGVVSQLTSVYFSDLNTGWIVGDSGKILKTTTGGLTFINPISIEIPDRFSLSQNYPNPFNPNTKFRFAIPYSGLVKLKIFDLIGREIETVVNEDLNTGSYEINWNASKYSSGVYFYKLESRGFNEIKKMILTK